MNANSDAYTERIHPDFLKSTRIRVIFYAILAFAILSFVFIFISFYITETHGESEWHIIYLKIEFYGLLPGLFLGSIAILVWVHLYVRTFSFHVNDTSIDIHSGILTKQEIVIPYTRIQNINIVQRYIERKFGLYTLAIETAGAPVVMNPFSRSHPEGLIPGIKNPNIIVDLIRHRIRSNNPIGSGVDNIFFNNPDLALDHFISIFLEKLQEGKDINNTIRELRKAKGLTQEQLAEAAGTSRQTIIQLENRSYNPSLKLAFRLAKILEVPVDNLFDVSDEDQDTDEIL